MPGRSPGRWLPVSNCLTRTSRSETPVFRRPSALLVLSLIAAAPAGAGAPAPILGHAVEYVIVTRDDLAPEFERLAAWKIQSGTPAAVKRMSEIALEYPGAADAADQVRRYLKDAWLTGARWALIGGDDSVIPMRRATTTYYGGALIPTDLYYACLDGTWDGDGDGLYGEGDPADGADLVPELFVGRAPVNSPAQAHAFVDRTLLAEQSPPGDFEHTQLFGAEVLFPSDWTPGNP